MQKNDVLTVEAVAMGTQGEGIAYSDGMTLFIPCMLPGERAEVRVLKTAGNIAYARVEELITPAEDRVRPKCPVFYRCGGCQLQHIRYRSQLHAKTELVRDTLKKIGGVEAKVSPCVRSEREYGYRNKLQLPIGRQNGENVVGFFAERSHRIVPTDECPIHPAWAKDVIKALKGFMEKCGLDGYDAETGTGQLRHIVVREIKKKFIVTLVSTEREIKGIDYFLYLLGQIFAEYSFYLNYNPSRSNVIFGREFTLLKGKGVYESSDGGVVFEAGVQTFMQVNDNVRGKLYEDIVSLAEGECVVDCYAGGGLLTALLAKKCGRAYGIEVVPEATACADRLRERNGLTEKMQNICGKVEEELAALLSEERPQTIVLDPPRSGVERSVLRLLKESGAERIIMVSCNPATLARDLGILTGTLIETEGGELIKCGAPEGAYEVTLVRPFDMFPQTKHVETLVLLKRR